MAKITNKVKDIITDVKSQWKVPKKGDHVSYKELMFFCLGATGANSIQSVFGNIIFLASSFLVGSVYGIGATDIATIALIGMPFSFIFSPIHMNIQDNLGKLPEATNRFVHTICLICLFVGIACYFIPQRLFEKIQPALPQIIATILVTNVFNSYFKIIVYKFLSPKFGKFICWMVAGAVPTMIMFMLIVYVDFRSFQYYEKLWKLHLCFCLFNIFNAFTGQVGNIMNVISPNTDERAKIMSVGSVIFSLGPSIVSIFLPIVCDLTTGGMNEIQSYRIILPIFAFLFFGLVLFMIFGVKEKVIVEKNHKPNVGFIKGFKSVMRNKYFWLTNISGVFVCLTTYAIALTNILFVFTLRQDWLIGLYAGITGTACVPGMILAPILIKKFGKKKIILFSRITTMFLGTLCTLACMQGSFVWFAITNYIVILINSPLIVVNGAVTADIWDYQQKISGERLDGCAGILPLLLTPLTLIGGMILPAVYRTMGYDTDTDIFFLKEFRNPILVATMIFAVVGSLLSLLPYFFYDLTEEKHKKIIEELHLRALASENAGREYESLEDSESYNDNSDNTNETTVSDTDLTF